MAAAKAPSFRFASAKRALLVTAGLSLFVGCNANSPENRYLLAERLLEDRKYEAAISEFQEIVDRSPYSPLGVEAQLKVAQIQHLYLGHSKDAADSYRLFLRRNKDEARRQEVEKVLADIQFQNFESYQEAVSSYQALLAKDPSGPMAENYHFNIGRSHYLRAKFPEAIRAFEALIQAFPQGKFVKKAELEIANSLNASGKCKEAIKKYEAVAKVADTQELKALALFGQAGCHEEQDDLDRAYELLSQIRDIYPVPSVVDLKMKKIKRRKILRKR